MNHQLNLEISTIKVTTIEVSYLFTKYEMIHLVPSLCAVRMLSFLEYGRHWVQFTPIKNEMEEKKRKEQRNEGKNKEGTKILQLFEAKVNV